MFEKADSQQYVEVCTLLLCGWSNYYTSCCLVLMVADGLFFCPLPQSYAGIFVCAWFHSDVSRYHFWQEQPSGYRLNTSVLCSPQAAQMHTCQFIPFLESTFRFLSGLKHAMIFVCWEKLPFAVHKSICPRCCHWHTPAWPTELAANIEWVSCHSDYVITAPDWTSGLLLSDSCYTTNTT